MISVVTPTFNTSPDVLARTWASLKRQTFRDWEWVVWDDSTEPGPWRQVYGFASDERYRVVAHRSHVHSGNIGLVKRNGFMVASGDILLELDHDDELTPDCLSLVNDAFANGAEFVYSDWCEILPDGHSGRYPEGWGFGYGGHYWDNEHSVWAMKAPEINRVTLSHIVSAPNHVRAWDADLYRKMGGHNPELPIADDYELMVRTALLTDLTYIPKMLYKQHVSPHTAQRVKNDQIQQFVAKISAEYSERLNDKFLPQTQP